MSGPAPAPAPSPSPEQGPAGYGNQTAEQPTQVMQQEPSYYDMRLITAAHYFESLMPTGEGEKQQRELTKLQGGVKRIMDKGTHNPEALAKGRGIFPPDWRACQVLDAYIELARMNFDHGTEQAAEVYRFATEQLNLGYDQTIRPNNDPDFNPREERGKLKIFNTLQDALHLGVPKSTREYGRAAMAGSVRLLSDVTAPVERKNPLWSKYYGESSPLDPAAKAVEDSPLAEIDRIMTSSRIITKTPALERAELEALRKSAGEGIESRLRAIEGRKLPDPHAGKRWTPDEIREEQLLAVIEHRHPHPSALPTTWREQRRIQKAERMLRKAEQARRNAHNLQRVFGTRIGVEGGRPLFQPEGIPQGRHQEQHEKYKKRASDLGTPAFRERIDSERLTLERRKAEIIADARVRSYMDEHDMRYDDLSGMMLRGSRAPSITTNIGRAFKHKFDRRGKFRDFKSRSGDEREKQ